MAGATAILTHRELTRLREVAGLLLPGDEGAPPAGSLPDLDENLVRAVTAVGREAEIVRRCVAALPDPLDWASLRIYATDNAVDFEVLSTVVAGAYFMSPAALDAIGYPRGQRRPARLDQAAEEIGSGLLDPVLARGSRLREVLA